MTMNLLSKASEAKARAAYAQYGSWDKVLAAATRQPDGVYKLPPEQPSKTCQKDRESGD